MNILRRALLSLRRRLPKTLLLLLLLVVLGTSLGAIIAIREGIQGVSKDIKEQLGSVITTELRPDLTEEEFISAPRVSDETLEEISASTYVESTEQVHDQFLVSDELSPIEASVMQVQPFRFFTTQYELPLYFRDGSAVLQQGRGFNEEELSSRTPSIIMHKELAEQNNLSIGDSINFYMYIGHGQQKAFSGEGGITEDEKAWFNNAKIIGLFTYNEQEERNSLSVLDTAGSEKNHIYVNDSSMKPFYDAAFDKELMLYEEGLYVTDFEPRYFYFYATYWRLHDSSDFKAFVEENAPLLPKEYQFISSLLAYDYLLDPIDQNVELSNTLLIASIATVLLVTTLVIFLFLKDRKKELGIYLSLGEKKRNIRLQILIEVLLITVLALAISLFLGEIIGDQLSQDLIRERLTASEATSQNNYDETQMSLSLGLGYTHTSEKAIQESYQIEMTLRYMLMFIGLGAITIFIATLLALEFSLRVSPKKVLMDH